jgi:CheY-like chemotaxis protein
VISFWNHRFELSTEEASMNPTVVVLADDLFWKTKIDHTLKSAQANGVFIEESSQLAARAESGRVGLVIVDLALRDDPFAAIAALKKSPRTKHIAVVGYYEHVRKDLLEKGEKAGCDQVLPRSAFSQHLGDIVMKYALPGGVRAEEEEKELPEE